MNMSKKRFLQLFFWFLAGFLVVTVRESVGRTGSLIGNMSILNVLIIGSVGGFCGILLLLMGERAKLQKGYKKDEKLDTKRAAKRYLGIQARAYLIIWPLMIVGILVVFFRPFNSWLDIFIAGLCLFVVLIYYILVQRKKVRTFLEEDVANIPGVGKVAGQPIRYRFSGKDFFIMVVLILLGFALIIGVMFIYKEIDSPKENLLENNIEEGEEMDLPEVGCTKEGKIKCDAMGCKDCCEGLGWRYVRTPMKNINNEVVCIEEMTQQICVNCGNGICGDGESWCVCPEDCEKPETNNLEVYPFEESNETVAIKLLQPKNFDLIKGTLSGLNQSDNKAVKIITTVQTDFYVMVDNKIVEYLAFEEMAERLTGWNNWPIDVEGFILSEENNTTTIMATKVFYYTQ